MYYIYIFNIWVIQQNVFAFDWIFDIGYLILDINIDIDIDIDIDDR